MLIPPNDQIKGALRTLDANDPAFDKIMDWFTASHAQLDRDSEKMQEVPMYRNQGARQLLSEFEAHLRAATAPHT